MPLPDGCLIQQLYLLAQFLAFPIFLLLHCRPLLFLLLFFFHCYNNCYFLLPLFFLFFFLPSLLLAVVLMGGLNRVRLISWCFFSLLPIHLHLKCALVVVAVLVLVLVSSLLALLRQGGCCVGQGLALEPR